METSSTRALVNRVEQSGIITLDLAQLLPAEAVVPFDLRQFLVKDLVLMEKPYREALKQTDWSSYNGKVVALHCSNDALIPMWAYMLAAAYLMPQAREIIYGNPQQAEAQLLIKAISMIDEKQYEGARVVVKGCGDKQLPPDAFVAITQKLQPVAQSLMYGEPCSTVPVYKIPKSE